MQSVRKGTFIPGPNDSPPIFFTLPKWIDLDRQSAQSLSDSYRLHTDWYIELTGR